MSWRAQIAEMFAGFLGFGRVVETKQATNTKQVLASIEGNSDSGGGPERRPFQALWGHAAIQFRPPTDTEVMFVRLSDEMIPIASREIRWGIELAEGEVVVRNLVDDASKRARIHIKADGSIEITAGGTIIVDAPEVQLTGTSALALSPELANHIDAIASDLTTIAASAGTVPVNYSTVAKQALDLAHPIAAQKVKGS